MTRSLSHSCLADFGYFRLVFEHRTSTTNRKNEALLFQAFSEGPQLAREVRMVMLNLACKRCRITRMLIVTAARVKPRIALVYEKGISTGQCLA
jgi:hypothetical protein